MSDAVLVALIGAVVTLAVAVLKQYADAKRQRAEAERQQEEAEKQREKQREEARKELQAAVRQEAEERRKAAADAEAEIRKAEMAQRTTFTDMLMRESSDLRKDLASLHEKVGHLTAENEDNRRHRDRCERDLARALAKIENMEQSA